jgi:dolichyl-phosphate beta-glucosyltransferase
MPQMPEQVSPSPERLTIVLPTYNEEQRIGGALDELLTYLARDGGSLNVAEVIVADDGSTDRTAALVEARRADAAPAIRLLRLEHRGKGSAVQAGMLAADTEMIVFSDADFATPPDQIRLLVEALASHDLALGSRIQPDGTDRRASQPRYRRLLGRVFHRLAGAWVTGRVPDTQCGFKGFRRDVAHDLFTRQRIDSIVFDAEIIHLARRLGYSIVSVPVQWSDKRGSRLRPRPRLALQVLYDLLRIPLIHRRVTPPPKG